jgi:hypothetical protein
MVKYHLSMMKWDTMAPEMLSGSPGDSTELPVLEGVLTNELKLRSLKVCPPETLYPF